MQNYIVESGLKGQSLLSSGEGLELSIKHMQTQKSN